MSIYLNKSLSDLFQVQYLPELDNQNPNITPMEFTDRGQFNKGIPKSEEHKRKLSLANIGKKATPETKAKLSAMRLGKPVHSEEWKQKMSEMKKGNTYATNRINTKHSMETKAKMSMAKKGKPWSEARRNAVAKKQPNKIIG